MPANFSPDVHSSPLPSRSNRFLVETIPFFIMSDRQADLALLL